MEQGAARGGGGGGLGGGRRRGLRILSPGAGRCQIAHACVFRVSLLACLRAFFVLFERLDFVSTWLGRFTRRPNTLVTCSQSGDANQVKSYSKESDHRNVDSEIHSLLQRG